MSSPNSSNKKRCCDWFCKIFRKKSVNSNSDSIVGVNQNQIITDTNNIDRENNNVCVVSSSDDLDEKIKNLKRKFKIDTMFEKSNIVSKTSYEKKIDNRYNCPICLNYFNHVLKLSCCKNYICILCSEDYMTTCIKYDFLIKCPFCGISDQSILLKDIDEDDPIKNYSDDSPIKYFKKNKTIEIRRITLSEENDNYQDTNNPYNINFITNDEKNQIQNKENIKENN